MFDMGWPALQPNAFENSTLLESGPMTAAVCGGSDQVAIADGKKVKTVPRNLVGE